MKVMLGAAKAAELFSLIAFCARNIGSSSQRLDEIDAETAASVRQHSALAEMPTISANIDN